MSDAEPPTSPDAEAQTADERSTEEAHRRETSMELVRALPDYARGAADAWLRTAVWSVEASARIARVILSPDNAAKFIGEFRAGVREYARELLGIHELDHRVREVTPGPATRRRAAARADPPTDRSLRAQGAELLRESADLNVEDDVHPAYARILAELAPDEARILRLLKVDGPQPTIDVRSANLIGVGSQLVAQTLNMVGTEAGCRHPERVPAYLNNLERLGLVWFPQDPIDNPQRYQVLEAQPDAIEAMKRAGRAKTVHRRVELTAFGKDFCDVVLPSDEAEIEALTASVSSGSERDSSAGVGSPNRPR